MKLMIKAQRKVDEMKMKWKLTDLMVSMKAFEAVSGDQTSFIFLFFALFLSGLKLKFEFLYIKRERGQLAV